MSNQSGFLDNREVKSFVRLAVASGLVSGEAMQEFLAEFLQENPGEASGSLDTLIEFLIRKEILTSWQADKLRHGKYKGFFIDNYVVLDHSQVHDAYSTFLARDTITGRQVTLAIWPPTTRPARDGSPAYRVLHDGEDA